MIADLSVGDHDPIVFDRVRDVLDLIASVDSKRFHRLQRDVTRIFVTHYGGAAGSYWSDLNACLLDWSDLGGNLHSAAMTLVHEATHARLEKAGIPYCDRLRERIERLCIREEIAFARQLPNSDELVEEAQHAMSSRWWTPESQKQRHRQQLESLRWPSWALRLRDFVSRG